MKVTRNELRLGNLLGFEGETCIVREINSSEVVVLFDNCEEEWIYLSQFNSIPLTEEWLLGFGFTETTERDDDSKSFEINFGRKSIRVIWVESNIWMIIFRVDIGMDYHELCDIEFIHQLQNITFALTGEELTITKTIDPL